MLRIKIPEEFLDEDEKEFVGEYEIRKLSGEERLDADEKASEERMDSEIGELRTVLNYSKWGLLLLEKSLMKVEGKERRSFTEDQLKEFPPKLLDLFIPETIRLNALSRSERRFLLSQSSSEDQPMQP